MKICLVSLSLIFALGILTTYAESNTIPTPAQIVNGRNAYLGQFPYILSLQRWMLTLRCVSWWGRRFCYYSYAWKHVCGAALVHPSWAVTAKHCFKGVVSLRHMRVKAGILCLRETGQVRSIVLVRIVGRNDFAIMKLSAPLKGLLISPIPLAHNNMSFSHCIVAGWGRNIAAVAKAAPCLQWSPATIVPSNQCARPSVWSFCARHPTSSACLGDSGGPFVCLHSGKWHLVGLVSYGSKTCPLNGPIGYIKIAYFRNWINRLIAG